MLRTKAGLQKQIDDIEKEIEWTKQEIVQRENLICMKNEQISRIKDIMKTTPD